MTAPDPAAQTLHVPGARLYYEQRGSGPLLFMIGSPMDSTGFEFPGEHGGFLALPEQCGRVLDQVLSQRKA